MGAAKCRIAALCFILSAIATAPAAAVSGNEMLLGMYDCEEYGGQDALAVYGDQLEIYPGVGEVTLHFRRHELQAASNTEDVVVHSVLGQDIPATSLSEDVIVRLSLEGSMSAYPDAGYATSSRMEALGLGGDFWTSRDPRHWVPEIPPADRLWYSDVLPGVDFWYFDDTSRREFDFLARPGASLSNVTLRVEGTQPSTVDGDGNLVFLIDCATLVFGQPRIYQTTSSDLSAGPLQPGTPMESYSGTYEGGSGVVRFRTPPLLSREGDVRGYSGVPRLKGPEMSLVSASGDTNGPPYDYHVSTFETRNGEFVDFLNSAQRGETNLLGTNLFFDAQGNVWFNPRMKPGRDEVFSISESRIVYRADRSLGERYAITDRRPQLGESYTNHPVVGVSWFGAVKYCNWLTLATGRGVEQRCYREGTNAWDWAPATCAETNWQAGVFSPRERAEWIRMRGYRLLMDDCSGTNGWGNTFSEFYKAATWNGTTNVPYGFGRTNAIPGDANFRWPNALTKPDTTPVGFFDGSDHDGQMTTRTNCNAYGIYGLSGNVDEWVNDFGITNSPLFRGTYGGSWFSPPRPVRVRGYARPGDTQSSRGFRVSATYAAADMFIVRIPYYACLCGSQYVVTVTTLQPGETGTGLLTKPQPAPPKPPGHDGLLKKKPPKEKPGKPDDDDDDDVSPI